MMELLAARPVTVTHGVIEVALDPTELSQDAGGELIPPPEDPPLPTVDAVVGLPPPQAARPMVPRIASRSAAVLIAVFRVVLMVALAFCFRFDTS